MDKPFIYDKRKDILQSFLFYYFWFGLVQSISLDIQLIYSDSES